jgi:hypothetical protein
MIIRNLQMKVNLRIFGHSVVVISRHSVRIFATSLRQCPQPADMQKSGERCTCVFTSLDGHDSLSQAYGVVLRNIYDLWRS